MGNGHGNYLTTNGLMKHLRNSNIDIKGSTQKRNLINHGYYHGYKGYRFFKNSNKRLPLSNYNEIQAIIDYDNNLKQLFYSKIMFIETAIKNIVLNIVMSEAKTNNIEDIYDRLILSYKNSDDESNEDKKKKYQKKKLDLQNIIHRQILKAYNGKNPKITHFYNNRNYSYVPVWAIFEVLMLGDFGFFVSCLNKQTRDKISKELKLNLAADTNREAVYKIIYTIKDLRNSIAHNDIIFDTRFNDMDVTKPVKKGIEADIGLTYINFKSIDDYVILVCYLLKNLYIPKRDILAFINQYEKILNNYRKEVGELLYKETVHPNNDKKIQILKTYINKR